MDLYLGLLTIFVYLTATALQSLHLLGRLSIKRAWFWKLALLGAIFHGCLLYTAIETPEGQNLHWLIMLSFTCWLMNLMILLMCLKARFENLCIFSFPISIIAIALGLGQNLSYVIQTKAHPLMLLHILTSFAAMSFFLLANGQAILMGRQHQWLKSHHPSPILRILPPLQTMEALLFCLLISGLVFLMASLVSGFYAPLPWFHASLLPKTVLSLLAFGWLVILLVGRFLFGWRGHTAVRLTLSGTGLALLSYFGTKAICL